MLSKLVSSVDGNVGKRIGFLFMFNTLGAAFGCFLADCAFIRILGVLGAGAVACSLNVGVAALSRAV